MSQLEVYTGFKPEIPAEYFTRRTWPVTFVQRESIELVRVQKGAPLECGDGRFDQLEERRGRVSGF